MRILFTGVGRRIELLQAFRNAALVLNKDLKIFGADMTGTAPALAYCDFERKATASVRFLAGRHFRHQCAMAP